MFHDSISFTDEGGGERGIKASEKIDRLPGAIFW